MLALLHLLTNLPWRLLGIIAVVSALFISGCQFGENRINANWAIERNKEAAAVAKREQQVAQETNAQTTINQEISNDIQQKTAILTSDQHLLDRIPQRVRIKPSGDNSPMPSISSGTTGANASAAYAVSDSEQSTGSCEKLAEDAAQTTLMVMEFQRWYKEQADAFSQRTD